MSILYGTKINQLLANTAPTGLLFADWLKKKSYSVQLQKKYRDSGWLTAICTGARLNAYDAIASYNKQMGGTML
ncbi:AbiEi antitoxin N-terminal domain-containing protein [Prevotella sp.]|uniref:AbiEi antitoxin N-terminal domain-containing protein n=1 Tax=Prevotella sp. TaxID=59823 RepID=UPI00307FA023